MSFTNKSQSTQNQFYCEVCKISISTEAEYALHEFSKKHCDNLLRIAKNKPVVNKQKIPKTEVPSVPKEPPKVNVPATPGNFAKYGYFVPGEVYDTAVESKEFNTEYDPYLQKFAENPLKESPAVVKPVEVPVLPTSNITSFKRKKKKKIRTCQICNVTLSTVPEYEAHMRSPQHSWKLKMSGMGVSAHFVKASSDLHTVEINEDSGSNDQCEAVTVESAVPNGDAGSSLSTVFPTLYCDICELLLNSEQQFNAHVSGKSHNDNVQRKAEVRAKKQLLENPSPNQLYCFSCKVALNNLYQYNEHKYGKKHKMKCRKLMREGITIPPEERVASWGMPRIDPSKPVVYPEMYEKYILETQKKGSDVKVDTTDQTKDLSNSETYCGTCCLGFANNSEFQHHINSQEHCSKVSDKCSTNQTVDEKVSIPRMVFHNKFEKSEEQKVTENVPADVEMKSCEDEENKCELNILGVNDAVKCSVCCQDFADQSLFDIHTTTEEHARKILEVKGQGRGDNEILEMLFKDKTFVKPDKLGMYCCSVCSITTGNAAEFHQHISSVVHKKSEEDYKKKRRIEIKSAVSPNESGNFVCKSCQESSASLVEFNEHLHTIKHRESIKAEKAKRMLMRKKSLLLQKKRVKQKYIISGLKRKDFACWRRNCEKNPGVRTKITGMATDLHTGQKATIPNLEPLEPKIDSAKNVSIGLVIGEKPEEEKPEVHVRRNMRVQPKSYHSGIEPLMKEPRPFPMRPPPNMGHPRHRRPPSLMHARPWGPYSPMHHMRHNPFGGNLRYPYPFNHYQRGPDFHPPWPRYPPCYK
ncbi:UNVERIFIED_CONTAM: hypothetical protein PYX00_000744 [Menopon gallinae]|uniref:Matrin-type domain-containing protein n=1 Tax=Menopon gallinae TaxID=328185 RepID=A0AAW2IBJ5_9NEOP